MEEAIALYVAAFRQQFSGRHGAVRKAQRLRRFLAYLEAQHHSLHLTDLTYADGQAFLDALVNANDGRALGLHNKKRYKSAACSFSRFLFQRGIVDTDLFLDLIV